jgi:hypothetical protein
MAPVLEFEELVELGCELCGRYTTGIDEDGRGFASLPFPMTSKAKIAGLIDRASGLYGARLARMALRYVEDGSRSPRESKLAISLRLPRRRGGQSGPPYEFNHQVPLAEKYRRMAGKPYYEIDLFFPDGNVGLEYLGKDYHEGPVRTVGDLRRESILADLGTEVHDVTRIQAENALEVARLARVIRKACNLRWRSPSPAEINRSQAVLDKLYRRSLQPWWDAGQIAMQSGCVIRPSAR